MKTNLFFHGTSSKQAAAIKRGGFDSSKGNLKWNVSDCKNYFLSYRKVKQENCCESKSDTLSTCLQDAAFHAAFAAAADGSDSCVIFAVDLSGIDYEPDNSCCYPTAVQVEGRVSRKRIVGEWKSNKTAQAFAPLVVSQAINNRCFSDDSFPDHILRIAKTMTGIFFEDEFGGFYEALFA